METNESFYISRQSINNTSDAIFLEIVIKISLKNNKVVIQTSHENDATFV